MDKYFDTRLVRTSVAISFMCWLGYFVSQSYDKLIIFSYQFNTINESVITLTKTMETNQESIKVQIQNLEYLLVDMEKRLNKVERKMEK